ncbi:MAG: ATP-binding protein, partial [Pseudomonadota bacterium]
GVGIEPQDLEQVLKPFGQTGNPERHSEQGTGLGLSIVKSLIEAHGGSIAIKSDKGIGTSVTLFFGSDRLVRDAA